VQTWTGFYAGLNIGGGWSSGNAQYGNTLYRSSTNGPINGYAVGGPSWVNSGSFSGVIGGGQIGYNHQITPMFVVGIEADFQGTSLSGQSSNTGAAPRSGTWSPSTGTGSLSQAINWFGTVRGRFGISPFSSSPNILIFSTAGFAYGGVNTNSILTTVVNDPVDISYGTAIAHASINPLLTGWTAGGGAEWSPSNLPSWSLKVEYLYTDLGGASSTGYGLGPSNGRQGFMTNALTGNSSYRFNTDRACVNYHFNFAKSTSSTIIK
jgi:outer membrane immunogenic protein